MDPEHGWRKAGPWVPYPLPRPPAPALRVVLELPDRPETAWGRTEEALGPARSSPRARSHPTNPEGDR
jgi:hypothetical protein